MTREEHISNLETIGCDGWTVTTEAYKSLQFAIEALEQEPYVLCINCRNFDESDNYCKLLQINFLPDGFGCNKGE